MPSDTSRTATGPAADPSPPDRRRVPRVCIVGVSGKLGQYLAQHALDRGYEVVGVCRESSVDKLGPLRERITVVPGPTNDRAVISRAVAGCDGVLTVLIPVGRDHYSSGTAQAVLDVAAPGARLVFSSGWHITRDGKDVYPWKVKLLVLAARLAKLAGRVDLDDQVEACRRIFASDADWTLVRASDLEEGESQGLPVWSRHVGDPILSSNITRRVDFALFMVDALTNDGLIHEAPAIVGRRTSSAQAYASAPSPRGYPPAREGVSGADPQLRLPDANPAGALTVTHQHLVSGQRQPPSWPPSTGWSATDWRPRPSPVPRSPSPEEPRSSTSAATDMTPTTPRSPRTPASVSHR